MLAPLMQPLAVGFFLVLVRCTSLFLVAPIFSAKTIPALVRIGFAVPIAVAVFMGAGSPVFVGWDRTAALIPAVAMEILMGVGAGLAARFAIEAALGAGSAIAIAAGISFGSVIDPLHGAESTAIGDLLSYLTMAVALSTGLHRDAVVWLCRSVQEPRQARIFLWPPSQRGWLPMVPLPSLCPFAWPFRCWPRSRWDTSGSGSSTAPHLSSTCPTSGSPSPCWPDAGPSIWLPPAPPSWPPRPRARPLQEGRHKACRHERRFRTRRENRTREPAASALGLGKRRCGGLA
jgi:hypothetical protein